MEQVPGSSFSPLNERFSRTNNKRRPPWRSFFFAVFLTLAGSFFLCRGLTPILPTGMSWIGHTPTTSTTLAAGSSKEEDTLWTLFPYILYGSLLLLPGVFHVVIFILAFARVKGFSFHMIAYSEQDQQTSEHDDNDDIDDNDGDQDDAQQLLLDSHNKSTTPDRLQYLRREEYYRQIAEQDSDDDLHEHHHITTKTNKLTSPTTPPQQRRSPRRQHLHLQARLFDFLPLLPPFPLI